MPSQPSRVDEHRRAVQALTPAASIAVSGLKFAIGAKLARERSCQVQNSGAISCCGP
jgi:hypothetical protein